MEPVVDIVVGTRPEAIKLAPVAHELARRGTSVRLVFTGQHRELVEDLLGPLGLEDLPRVDLRVMAPGQRLNGLAARLVARLGDHLEKAPPALVLVQGDTTSALCAALCAFHERIPVGHVEAGLRTGRLDSPFPEEANRQLVSRLASWHFCPTERAVVNLLAEGVDPVLVLHTGNTVIDTLLAVTGRGLGRSAFPARAHEGQKVLVTLHRREHHGEVLASLAAALVNVAERRGLELVVPLHPHPAVREAMAEILGSSARVTVTGPLGYLDFVATLGEADVVVTDSGGVQEEAPALGVPVLVVRETTERPEAIEAGCARLVGTDPKALESHLEQLVADPALRAAMTRRGSPFGDGHAAERIVGRLLGDVAGLVRARPAPRVGAFAAHRVSPR